LSPDIEFFTGFNSWLCGFRVAHRIQQLALSPHVELLTGFSSWRCCLASRYSSYDRLCCTLRVGIVAGLKGPVGDNAICGVATTDFRLSTLCL
jgi:hypothetical protein